MKTEGRFCVDCSVKPISWTTTERKCCWECYKRDNSSINIRAMLFELVGKEMQQQKYDMSDPRVKWMQTEMATTYEGSNIITDISSYVKIMCVFFYALSFSAMPKK